MDAATHGERIVLSSYADGREALRHKDLREATHDESLFLLSDTLLVLHAEAHTVRRRAENRAFRRDRLVTFEQQLLDPIVDEVLPPYLAAGRADLVEIAHRLVMNLSAEAAGIDRPDRTADETERLYTYMKHFSEGATIADSTRDKDAVRAEVLDAVERFSREFFAPSAERRHALLADPALADSDRPRDVLSVLLEHQARLGMPAELIPREVALFLVGAHTAANQITHLVHAVFGWIAQHTEDQARLTDLRFLQRAMQESVRLNPPTLSLMRGTPDVAVTLRTGVNLPPNAVVEVDLIGANRDPAIFGTDAEVFNPYRSVPPDAFPWGLSFGAGTHTCIGQEMAAGLAVNQDAPGGEPLFGAVPRLVRTLLQRGLRPDPDQPPRPATHTVRREWGTYPVVFAPVGAVV